MRTGRFLGLRGFIALWFGKLLTWLSRLVGRGGTNLPGKLARRLDPLLLVKLSRQASRGVVLVSGTNGKTTTSSLIYSALGRAGYAVVHNRSGANLIAGITSSFIAAATGGGIILASHGVIEVDEATMPAAVGELRPRVVLLTNLFRDQLDRYGELEHTREILRSALNQLEGDAQSLLNADDPLVAFLGEGLGSRAIFYGIQDRDAGRLEPGMISDGRFCPYCGSAFRFELFYYAHLGIYSCPGCKRSRPEPAVTALNIERLGIAGTRFDLVSPYGTSRVTIKVPGLYNVYNALSAATALLALGLPLDKVTGCLESFPPPFGRMEQVNIAGRNVYLSLVKNPAGFNEVIKTIAENGRLNLLVAINDRYADGTDISWLWDVEFERLAGAQGGCTVASGLRAEDMALRLKYAGLDLSSLAIEPDLGAALSKALEACREGDTLYVLSTYTAMLEMRELLGKMGYVKRFWQD